jgi:dihydropteroate synthase
MFTWKFGKRKLDFTGTPLLMGILNVTPDSFSDGGRNTDPETAVRNGLDMLKNGAAILDVGGESSRPGASPVPEAEEIRRTIPVIRELKRHCPEAIISIDTTKTTVAEAAIRAGAEIVNDISGLAAAPELADLTAQHDVGLVLMHMRGTPATMRNPENLVYTDVVSEVGDFLEASVETAVSRGVSRDAICIDPGIGFAKTSVASLEILNRIDELARIGCPILVGPSRKSLIGDALGEQRGPLDRVWGTAGIVAWLLTRKVDVIRVHDVREMAELLLLFRACKTGMMPAESPAGPTASS